MEQINILMATHLSDEGLKMIAAVSPRIKLWEATDLDEAEKRGDFSGRGKYDAMLSQAEIVYGATPPLELMRRAPRLKWVQARRAGVDYAMYKDIFASPVIVTNGRGNQVIQVSEMAVALMIMLAKQAPAILRRQQEKKWQWFVPIILHSKTVGIVGMGAIGKEIARLAKAYHMNVIATRRSTLEETHSRYADKLLPKDRLPELLAASDFVILALPATPETDRSIGEKEFRMMKPTAYLINIARGSVVDEPALIRALQENWIAGAGLDAFTVEPLPVTSPLWSMPNVICTPHMAGAREKNEIPAAKLFCENIRRYMSGKRLLNLVNKKTGY